MKEGWARGMAVGAVVGMSAVAMFSAMNRNAKKRVVQAMTGTAQKLADKAGELIK